MSTFTFTRPPQLEESLRMLQALVHATKNQELMREIEDLEHQITRFNAEFHFLRVQTTLPENSSHDQLLDSYANVPSGTTLSEHLLLQILNLKTTVSDANQEAHQEPEEPNAEVEAEVEVRQWPEVEEEEDHLVHRRLRQPQIKILSPAEVEEHLRQPQIKMLSPAEVERNRLRRQDNEEDPPLINRRQEDTMRMAPLGATLSLQETTLSLRGSPEAESGVFQEVSDPLPGFGDTEQKLVLTFPDVPDAPDAPHDELQSDSGSGFPDVPTYLELRSAEATAFALRQKEADFEREGLQMVLKSCRTRMLVTPAQDLAKVEISEEKRRLEAIRTNLADLARELNDRERLLARNAQVKRLIVETKALGSSPCPDAPPLIVETKALGSSPCPDAPPPIAEDLAYRAIKAIHDNKSSNASCLLIALELAGLEPTIPLFATPGRKAVPTNDSMATQLGAYLALRPEYEPVPFALGDI